jgi:hypothetical protein
MEKQILSELNRLKSLMGLMYEQGSADINIDRVAKQQLNSNGYKTGKYKTKIGEGTDYKVVLPGYYTYAISQPYSYSPPSIKMSGGKNISAKDFIDNVNVDDKGNEFIKIGGKKYCLPRKEFWDSFVNGNYVYQIINPNNGKIFSMFLTTSPEVRVPTINNDGTTSEKTIPGYEASLLCQGGDNGWSFLTKDQNIFWYDDNGTARSYNYTNPDHFDIRSDFDIWWDEYGWAVEVITGFIAAFTGAGLAAFLLEAFSIGGILAAGYAGGSATVLSVMMQALVEAGLMLPIISYQFERGMNDDAILNMVFCFFPFLTELGSVERFIKGGIQPQTTKDLSEKLSKLGGFGAMKNNPEEYRKFMDSLSGSELMLWKATCEQFSTEAGAKEFKTVLSEYLKTNQDRVLSDILGNDNLRKPMDKISGGMFSKIASDVVKSNPIKGTGFLAQLVRLGLPIYGVVVGFKKIYSTLQSHGYSDEQSEKIVNELKTSIDSNTFLKKLAEIDNKLFVELTEKLLIDYVSDKNNTDNILSGLLKSSEITKDLNEAAKKEMMENKELYKKYIREGNITEIEEWVSQLNNYVKDEILNYLEEKGETNVIITDIDPLKKYKYKTDKVPKGEILIKKQLGKPRDLSFNEPTDIEFKII